MSKRKNRGRLEGARAGCAPPWIRHCRQRTSFGRSWLCWSTVERTNLYIAFYHCYTFGHNASLQLYTTNNIRGFSDFNLTGCQMTCMVNFAVSFLISFLFFLFSEQIRNDSKNIGQQNQSCMLFGSLLN